MIPPGSSASSYRRRDRPGRVPSPLLEVADVHKRYGGAIALRGATLTLARPGRVHCLAGENGSGKSTLLGIISGNVSADAGSLRIDGDAVAFRAPHEALKRGIAMVSQETSIAPHLSVAENILLGRRLVRTARGIDWRATRVRAQQILRQLGLDYDLRAPAGKLAAHERQMIEIARAISVEARILILDEPTSSLSEDEVGSLMRGISALTGRGVAVLFVSHRLPEVFSVCDDITVLRDGQTVASGPIGEFTPESLVDAMIGQRQRPTEAPRSGLAYGGAAVPVLKVNELSALGCLTDISLQVQPGEIVGLAGLVASGRNELLEAIFGTRLIDSGQLRIQGREYVPRDPRSAMDAGIGYLPPDRKTQGLVVAMSIRDNLSMAAASHVGRLRRPNRRQQTANWHQAKDVMRIRARSEADPVWTLSGGNQQKVALGKWLVRSPSLLLLDEPTRGVDVGAKVDIYVRLRAVADQGVAMLVSSSEYNELLDLCDRVLVLFAGRLTAELDAKQATESDLAAVAGGHV